MLPLPWQHNDRGVQLGGHAVPRAKRLLRAARRPLRTARRRHRTTRRLGCATRRLDRTPDVWQQKLCWAERTLATLQPAAPVCPGQQAQATCTRAVPAVRGALGMVHFPRVYAPACAQGTYMLHAVLRAHN